jgi:3-deoxy-manno-octulosonate cytidylyltransferase (CMP-KDO synthetase)
VSLLIVIPARLESTRLPRKLLREVGGKPLLAHTIAAAQRIPGAEIRVATDDPQLVAVAQAAGVPALLTSTRHSSGTDRIAELVTRLGVPDERIVVNLQGDEPLMPPEPILEVARLLEADPGAAIATLGQPLTEAAELFDPACVKVVTDRRGRALYFSRAPIPWARDAFAQARDPLPERGPWLRHLGLYAYRAGALRQLAALPPSPLEQLEVLEQLRALDHGLGIAVGRSPSSIPPGIDTEADLRRLERWMLEAATTHSPARVMRPSSFRGVQPKRMLFVCMGNICRSPLAAAWAARRAREAGLQLEIASAGTHAYHRDRGADPRSQAIGRAAGLNLLSHRSRPVDPTDFVRYDLVIGHDQRNLDDLLAVCPEGLRHKVRLLLDFAANPGKREVPDPYTGDHEAFILAFRLIREGVDGLIEQISGARS